MPVILIIMCGENMDNKERNRRFNKRLKKEFIENVEKCLWMSFCDSEKPKGTQFLGVIITNTLGITHAIDKTHTLGINPGGEVMSHEISSHNINPMHFDKLLSSKNLKEYGYI